MGGGSQGGVFRPTGGSRHSHWRGPAAASAKTTEQISELGGSGGMPLGKIFFNNAKCCKLGNWAILSFFVRPLEPPVGVKG